MALTGKTVEERVWNYLLANGMTKQGVSALMGNFKAESGIIFNRVEILCLKRLKERGIVFTDETYTAAIDNGSISREEFLNPLPNKQYGYGIYQITSPNRKAGLYDLCKSRGVSIADEQAQLDWLMLEMQNSYKSVLDTLKTAKDIRSATEVVLRKFECPADCSNAVIDTRTKYAKEIYDKFANGKAPTENDIVLKIRNDAVQFAVDIANDNTHGYSQATRSLYNISNPKSFDCSSLVCTAYYYAFSKNGYKAMADYMRANCSYTGNMMKMLNCGFEIVARNQTGHTEMIRGDIELNETHHTALAVDKDTIVHARSSEGTSDTIDGSGNEIRVQPWYMYSKGWTHRLRFTGKGVNLANPSATIQYETTSTPSTTVLRKGSTGKEVKNLQAMLITIGYSCGKCGADGEFGNDTDKAVRAFQADFGLEVDGEYGKLTSAKLEAVYKNKVSATNETQYTVKVTAKSLNIRTGAGTSYTISGTITDGGVYTIVETKGNWGRLKSGMGWICLDYTRKL